MLLMKPFRLVLEEFLLDTSGKIVPINLMGGSLKAKCLHWRLRGSSYKRETFSNSNIQISFTTSRKSNKKRYAKDFSLCLCYYFYTFLILSEEYCFLRRTPRLVANKFYSFCTGSPGMLSNTCKSKVKCPLFSSCP